MLTRRAFRIKETLFSGDPNKGASYFSENTEETLGLTLKQKKNIGHWKVQEQTLYFIFLKQNREKFVDREIRRSEKIFREMAKAIKTRGADQCRSHHQKMDKKYPQFDELLGYLNENYGEFVEEVLQARYIEESKNQLSLVECGSENKIQIENSGVLEQNLIQNKEPSPPPPTTQEIEEQKFDQMSLLSFDAIHELEQCVQPVPLLVDQLLEDVCLIPHF